MGRFIVQMEHTLIYCKSYMCIILHSYIIPFMYSTSIDSYENCTSGTVALEQLGYNTDHNWIWYDQIGLAGLTLIFLIITYQSARRGILSCVFSLHSAAPHHPRTLMTSFTSTNWSNYKFTIELYRMETAH